MVRLLPLLGAYALFSTVVGVETAVRYNEQYETGLIHQKIMDRKMKFWAYERNAGIMESEQYPELGFTPCVKGKATAIPGNKNQTFNCRNMNLHHFLSHAQLNSSGAGSSSWGWTSAKGREFVAIGQEDGTAFVEINRLGRMIYLGRLPQVSAISDWREIRSYGDLMIIGSEAVAHGIQIFDMKKLLKINPKFPITFHPTKDLVSHYTGLPRGRTHNVVANDELDFIVAVGAAPRNGTCRAGLIFIDMKDPSRPEFLGCAADDGYVHDAQCVIYRGPDKKYQGKEICYGYNENKLTIYDVTNKNGTFIISSTSYVGASYTHQGSLLDVNNQEFLVLDDELDEVDGTGPALDGFPVTYIWDIRSLEAPKQTGYYKSGTKSIDHNQYVIDNYVYQSNYGAGMRVLDLTSVPSDPTGAGVCEAGFFDIYPEDDGAVGGGRIEFVGTWSAYAYFKSGYIFVNTIERGAFVVKMTSKRCLRG